LQKGKPAKDAKEQQDSHKAKEGPGFGTAQQAAKCG
jgi:hypothetical protein